MQTTPVELTDGPAPSVPAGKSVSRSELRRATLVIPGAGTLPGGHPLLVLDHANSLEPHGLIWDYALRHATEDQRPADPFAVEILLWQIDHVWHLPQNHPIRHNRAVLELVAHMLEALHRSKEQAARTVGLLDPSEPLEPSGLTILAPEPALSAPEDGHPPPWTPPAEHLALTTSVLTSAPPAPATPVQGAARAVPVAA